MLKTTKYEIFLKNFLSLSFVLFYFFGKFYIKFQFCLLDGLFLSKINSIVSCMDNVSDFNFVASSKGGSEPEVNIAAGQGTSKNVEAVEEVSINVIWENILFHRSYGCSPHIKKSP